MTKVRIIVKLMGKRVFQQTLFNAFALKYMQGIGLKMRSKKYFHYRLLYCNFIHKMANALAIPLKIQTSLFVLTQNSYYVLC